MTDVSGIPLEDQGIGPTIEIVLPRAVGLRLEARALAGHFVHPDGRPDLGALAAAYRDDRFNGQPHTLEQLAELMQDGTDADMAALLRASTKVTCSDGVVLDFSRLRPPSEMPIQLDNEVRS